jgi:GMP reductase
MKLENEIKLDFKDVLFRPKRSTLSSRNEVQVEREFKFKHSGRSWTGVPIISSNMDTISSVEMYKELSKKKFLTCFHKYININDIIKACQQGFDSQYFMLSTGITDKDFVNIQSQVELLKKNNIETHFICIDVANGYMFRLLDFCKKMRSRFPNITLIAGNVVTREIVEELIINGCVDIIKVGIGSGAVCTTRLQTGVGMPQFSAVLECSDAAHGLNAMIISDGGICYPGDVGKAFGGGADFVMVGSMLAGHTECPGDMIEENGKQYKLFYGMSSDTAMNKHHGGVASYRSSEGKTVKVPFKGPVENTLNNILGGVRSTCTYIGASRLKDINKCATFMRVNNIVNNYYS